MPTVNFIQEIIMRQSRDNAWGFRQIIKGLLIAQGRDFTKCELCGTNIPKGQACIHHTKYDEATLYDLKIVCRKCDKNPKNQNLK